jgi:glycosyltransferase involved in cell wall biosynthesis
MEQLCPISVLVPTKNEARNLGRCLEAIAGWADEIVIVDSRSEDATLEIAAAYDATVLQFDYKGGWPKKRQWALDTFSWRNDWILLLDADEILLPDIKAEIAQAIQDPQYDGYWIKFQIYFLGRMLRFGGSHLWKLSLFRKGKGHYELRLKDQDRSMCDMEVHEHVVVEGKTHRLRHPVRHENLNSLDQYITKHNEYSNWEARLLIEGASGEIEPSLFGNQAQRRRYLKQSILSLPGSPVAYFVLKYVFQLGWLDGTPGFIYAVFKAIQLFHTKAKLYEMKLKGGKASA